jgi:Glycoside hydrolase family 44
VLVAGCGGGGNSSTPPPVVKTTPTVTVTPSSTSISAAQTLTVTVAVNAGTAKPTGSITLTSGSYTSPPATLSNGAASINIPASTLAVGSDTLVGAYTPDTASSSTYNNATGTAQVTVTAPITSIAISPSTATIGAQVQFVATINGAASNSVNWTVAAPSGSGLSPGDITSTGLYTTPYPAPASVTVTATSTTDSTTTGSITVVLSQPPTATGPALLVDAGNQTHAISPFIYGINGYLLDSATTTAAHPGLVRWGGDGSSRYNYKTNISNSASDYYFENFNQSSFTDLIASNSAADAATMGTAPVLGWVSNSTANACSFPSTSFPGQTSYDSHGCGSGIYPAGTNGCTSAGGCTIAGSTTIAATTSISQPPPDITSPTTPAPGSVTTTWANSTWTGGWVNSILTAYGPANPASGKGQGAAVWDLDNEPTWWDAVHRDVHPAPFTYDEATNGGIGTALAIKTADPTALVSGPVIDYWWAYFYSKKDIESGWSSGPCYQPWSNPSDRVAHGGVPMIEYYLQQFNRYSQNYGIRLLDYVDIHGYFAGSYQGSSVGFTTAGDTAEQQVRMNSTRVLWDPTYTDPNYPQPNYTTDPNYTASCSPPAQAPQLIRMMQSWVARDYPGTKTGIDEYNFGGLESINGAVTQADVLGIFGREGLGLGALWPTGTNGQMDSITQIPANMAFAIYRNYDGNKSTFGDMALASTSTNSTNADGEGQLAVYGARRASDSALTVVVVNKTYGDLNSTLSLANFTSSSSTAKAYLYSNANLNAIVTQPDVTVTPPSGSGTTSTIAAKFPAQSITLFVIPR